MSEIVTLKCFEPASSLIKNSVMSDCGSSSSNRSTGAFTGSERASWKLDPDNSLWSTSSGFNMSEADGFVLCASCNINKANYRKHPDLLILKLSKVCE